MGASAEPKAESEPGAEPGPPNAEPVPPNAEPVPEWPASHEIWGAAWELHWIGLGMLFFCIAIWSLFALLQVRKRKLLATRRFCYAVNFLLLVFGTTRGLAMFLYPYEMVANAHGMPVVLQRLLFGIGFPCLTAGFTLIHFAFLEASKVSKVSRRIQSLRFLGVVIAIHFAMEIISEFTTSYIARTSALLIACMLYFILFSLAISISMLYSGLKVINSSKENRRTLKRLSLRDTLNSTRNNMTKKDKYSNRESNTTKVAYVTMVSASLGIACAVTQIYAMVCVFKVRADASEAHAPDPWPWWAYQTVFRVIELGLASTMAYTISHPKKGSYFGNCCQRIRGHDNMVLTNSSAACDAMATTKSSVRKAQIDHDIGDV